MAEKSGVETNSANTTLRHATGDVNLQCDTSGKVVNVLIAGTKVGYFDANGLNISSGNLLLGSTIGVDHTVQTLAAAGTDHTNGGAITGRVCLATGADGTKGVVLPAAAGSGKCYVVINQDNANLKIYPGLGDVIDAGSANAAITVAAYTVTVLWATSASQWWSGEIAKA